MDVHDAIILTVLANGGRVDNRTTMQKLIYFHTQKIQNLRVGQYIHHFYGPYSPEVAVALEEMGAFDLLEERRMRERYESYSYSLTERGKRFAEKIRARHEEEFKEISRVVDHCKRHCGLKAMPLSYAAKSHYIVSHADDKVVRKHSSKEIVEAGRNFGWNVTESDVETGVDLLKRLELVS